MNELTADQTPGGLGRRSRHSRARSWSTNTPHNSELCADADDADDADDATGADIAPLVLRPARPPVSRHYDGVAPFVTSFATSVDSPSKAATFQVHVVWSEPVVNFGIVADLAATVLNGAAPSARPCLCR
jgi:hypothetical protein